MKIYILIFFAIGILSCNESGTSKEGQDTTTQTVPSADNSVPEKDNISGCFMNVNGRDTLVANLYKNGNQVTGKLSFDNYQKDGSTGRVNGILEGGVMKLSYSFASEGTNSVMDVYFKVEENSIIRGIGEIKVRGDTAYFADTANIKYEGSELIRVDCSAIDPKYR